MRILTAPFQFRWEDLAPVRHSVMVCGPTAAGLIAPPAAVGLVDDPRRAGPVVGAYLHQQAKLKAYQTVLEKYGEKQADEMLERGLLRYEVPAIPGVTSEGTWVNARFGNPEKLDAWRLSRAGVGRDDVPHLHS